MGLGSLLFDWMFSAGGLLLLAAQAGCLIHILKTGRPYWWIWIIWGVPIIGLAAYIYLEVRPSFRRVNVQSFLWNFKNSQERIRILEERLEDSTTVRNRLALADELHRAGKHDQECQVVADGLRGPFADDPQLLLRLAEAHLEAGRSGEADKIVEKIIPDRSSDFVQRHKLLRARVYGSLGRDAQAEPLFRDLVAAKKSEAPRYYYAQYLLRRQQAGEAYAILKDILYKYRRGTPVWRYQERQWYYAAKSLLKAPRQA